MGPEPLVALRSLEHHVYCERKCALTHRDGVWVHNRHTLAGVRAHRRVDEDRPREERGRTVLRSIPLWSERLGLTGRSDAVEILSDGEVQPVEYKSGRRHGDAADVQLCAQALCLEEMLDTEIARGAVWFGGIRRRVAVSIDAALRTRTLEVIEAVRAGLRAERLPPAPADERCQECQLIDHCLPDVVAGDQESFRRDIYSEVFGCAT